MSSGTFVSDSGCVKDGDYLITWFPVEGSDILARAAVSDNTRACVCYSNRVRFGVFIR